MNTITRRQLVKGAAVVGGTVWIAPAVESFTARAAAVSPVSGQLPHVCCQCYSAAGAFIGAAIDDYSDAGCKTVCAQAVPGDTSGTFLRFVAPVPQSFTAVDPTSPNGGCYFNGAKLGGTPTTCPSTEPAGVVCDAGTWPI